MSEPKKPSCNVCQEPDNDEMVQCDKCDAWYHFICVQVTDSIADKSFVCPVCNEHREETGVIVSSSPKSSPQKPAALLAFEKLEEERRLLDEKYRLLATLGTGAVQTVDKTGTSTDQLSFKRNYCLDPSLKFVHATTSNNHQIDSRVFPAQTPVAMVGVGHNPNTFMNLPTFTSCDRAGNPLTIPVSHLPTSTASMSYSSATYYPGTYFSAVQHDMQHQSAYILPTGTTSGQIPLYANSATPGTSCTASSYCTTRPSVNFSDSMMPPSFSPMAAFGPALLNGQQLAARQVMPKDLPTFSGNPNEWPVFISSYEGSTITCGFSNTENLFRLQRCLKGKALETVRSLLLVPDTVPQAMDTLKLLYGRPEVIINSLLQTVRNQPAPRADRLETLVPYAIAVQNLCATMKACSLTNHLGNPMLLQELEDKLPAHLKLSWAIHKQSITNASLANFSDWLLQIAKATTTVSLNIDYTSHNTRPDRKGMNPRVVNAHANVDDCEPVNAAAVTPTASALQNARECLVCNDGSHNPEKCAKFLKAGLNDRWRLVKEHKLCRTCLKRHNQLRCKSGKICGVDECSFKHHHLLHNPYRAARTNPASNASCNAHRQANTTTLFRIVPVTLHGDHCSIETFAFLDEGSSVTLVESGIIRQLGLTGSHEELCLKWTDNSIREEPDSMRVSIGISGVNEGAAKHRMENARTVSRLNLPKQTISAPELYRSFPHLKGVPFQSFTDATPKVLIGIDNWRLGIPLQIKEGEDNEPVATKTRLGWVVHGRCDQNTQAAKQRTNNEVQSFHVCECKKHENLHDFVKKFMFFDTMGVNIPETLPESRELKRARMILNSTTEKVGNRYETGLLWKFDEFQLPDSFPMAMQRLRCLEKQMRKDPGIRETIEKTISDYIDKGYIRNLSETELKETLAPVWYLPIFIVTNPNKPGKHRLVWDAAAKVNNVSLNSFLLKGPDATSPLLNVIFQFREHAVAITGDIEEMFHQVRIRESDQHAQRFLYRDKEGKLIVYVMRVMTFGATCSPSSAQFVKNTNANRFADEYPRAVQIIILNHYVDDMLLSVEDEQEAMRLAKEVRHIHAEGGFKIRNWASNSPQVLEALGQTNAPQEKPIGTDKDNAKVLGLLWDTTTDCFRFALKFPRVDEELIIGKRYPTKREVLRIIMSIFDPLGLLAHYVVRGKIIMREVWRSPLTWDQLIPSDLKAKWAKFLETLQDVKELRIPRCYTSTRIREKKDAQLHIFVDASETAFAAVAYARIDSGTRVECTLIAAKTKMAPLKPISIPRLELQAAVLGARLANTIVNGHHLKFEARYFWTDSRTVLSWINSDPMRFKQYVAHRVGEILELTNASEWRKVPTELNVADEATKWPKSNHHLSINDRWFTGPTFLQENANSWPENPLVKNYSQPEEELLRPLLVHFQQQECVIDLQRFSSWLRLLRCMAYTIRFIKNCRHSRPQRDIGPLKAQEIEKAKQKLYQVAQCETYGEEIASLKEGKGVDRKSTLFKACPFLDDTETIRARGRIANAPNISYDEQYPVILPKKHIITHLIILQFHKNYHHQYHETVVNEIRQLYEIPNLRNLVKRAARNCQKCKNDRASPNPPMMADLPYARLASFTPPFTFVGVDYFGPMFVTVGRHLEKRWGVLFTCLTIRAIHIEIAHSLTSDSCIMAIINFMARRGTPKEIYSDNGTNFRGADEELRREVAKIDFHKIQEEIAVETPPKWNFNPPAAPHMGGAWERLIRSVKQTLLSIMPQRNPSDELLRSVLMEVEMTINSRPLTYIPLDTPSQEALTPNHFLVGNSNGRKPMSKLDDNPRNLRKNWKIAQQLSTTFWKRWIREYLPVITRRTKWFLPVSPLKVGDIVIIVNENLPRNSWPKGVIVDVLNTRSGQVRQATVQTAAGLFTRPATRLAVLDVRESELSSQNREETSMSAQPSRHTGGSMLPPQPR